MFKLYHNISYWVENERGISKYYHLAVESEENRKNV